MEDEKTMQTRQKSRIFIFLIALVVLIFLVPSSFSATTGHQFLFSENIVGVHYTPYNADQSPILEQPSIVQMTNDLIQISEKFNMVFVQPAQGNAAQVIDTAGTTDLEIVLQLNISADNANNEREIATALEIAEDNDNLAAIIVGSDVLLRSDFGDLGQRVLISFIADVQAAVDVPVGYADVLSTWEANPELVAAVDWIGLNSYPFWACEPIEAAASSVRDEWDALNDLPGAADKRIVVTQAGWPTQGFNPGCPDSATGGSDLQERFVTELAALANEDDVDVFYYQFSDQLWQCSLTDPNSVVGCFWGLVDYQKSPRAAWDAIPEATTLAEFGEADATATSTVDDEAASDG